MVLFHYRTCAHLGFRFVPLIDVMYSELVHLSTDPLHAMFTGNLLALPIARPDPLMRSRTQLKAQTLECHQSKRYFMLEQLLKS